MTDFNNKVQNKISRVKGLKGGHTSGWVKVLVGTYDKLYLYFPITLLKNVGFQSQLNHEFNVRLITDLRDYENKYDLQVQLEIPYISFKAILYHVASSKP